MLQPAFELPPHSLPRDLQILRQHPRFADRRHEVGIAHPARKSMHVQMIGDARAGAAANVEADIEALGPINDAKMLFGTLRKLDQFYQHYLGYTLESRDMKVRHDHEMAGGVGIAVDHDQIVRSPVDDEALAVM